MQGGWQGRAGDGQAIRGRRSQGPRGHTPTPIDSTPGATPTPSERRCGRGRPSRTMQAPEASQALLALHVNGDEHHSVDSRALVMGRPIFVLATLLLPRRPPESAPGFRFRQAMRALRRSAIFGRSRVLAFVPNSGFLPRSATRARPARPNKHRHDDRSRTLLHSAAVQMASSSSLNPTTRSRTLLFISYRDSRAGSSRTRRSRVITNYDAAQNEDDEHEHLINPDYGHISIDAELPPKW